MERLLPGVGIVIETGQYQRLLPGVGIINETQSSNVKSLISSNLVNKGILIDGSVIQ